MAGSIAVKRDAAGARTGRIGAAVLTALFALTVSLCGAVAVAPAASAHSILLSAVPAAGSELDGAPDEVVLTFNEPIQASTLQVAVTAASGASVTDGDPDVDGAVITQHLRTNLPNDEYTVAYRVTSVDGHPVRAALTFSVADSASTAPPLGAEATSGYYGDRDGTPAAQGETSLFAKVLYVALPLLTALLVFGVIRTRGRYRSRNPNDDGDAMLSPFAVKRAALPPEPKPQDHVYVRPDISRDPEP
jgi:methionine-rich copper-binding protein CopC